MATAARDNRTSTRRRVVAAAAGLAFAAPIPVAADPPTPGPSSVAPAAPTPGAPAVAGLPVTIQLADLTPLAPQPGDTLRVTGTMRNVSTAPISDLEVQLRYSPTHLGSRSEFDGYADPRNPDGTPAGPLPLPGDVATTVTGLAKRVLAPGDSEPFAISVPVDALGLLTTSWQVFPLGVEVLGSTTNGFDAVGGLRTFLPWAPLGVSGVGQPTPVSWVWPLVDQPHRSVGDTFNDDSLAKSFAPGGRLATLLSVGVDALNQPQTAVVLAKKTKKGKRPARAGVQPVPVTWAVDPMLVEDAAIMADGYKVTAGPHTSGRVARSGTPGTGTAAAKAWLASLRATTARSEVLALPYGDSDVVAATRSGSRLAAEAQVATTSGQSLVSRQLQTTPLTYSWPPGGQLDQHTLDTTLFGSGVTTVILDDRALPPVTAPNLTPSAHATVQARDGSVEALLSDHVLDGVVAAGAANPRQQRVALQRYLSELLMIQAELPSSPRPVVITPDRHWAPSAAYAAALLGDTGRVPWVQPVSLPTVLSSPVSDVARTGLKYPGVARIAELSQDYLGRVQDLKDNADNFAAILATGDPNARAFDDAVLRTLSASWRGHDDAAQSYRSNVATALDSAMRKVHIASAEDSFVTLTSHSGTVPITVANDLDSPVRVIVRLDPNQHLQVSGQGRVAQTIPAHRQVAVDVRASAKTSGVFQLDVSLLTPTGHVYDATRLYVRSTAYGFVAILITAGATGVLLLAVVIRLVRRALASRRSTVAAA